MVEIAESTMDTWVASLARDFSSGTTIWIAGMDPLIKDA
jgi:hypothetical protein